MLSFSQSGRGRKSLEIRMVVEAGSGSIKFFEPLEISLFWVLILKNSVMVFLTINHI